MLSQVLLFASRCLRLFGFGMMSLTLPLHLAALGFNPSAIGLLLTLTLAGDTGISFLLTLVADRLGRRRLLLVGAVLMSLAGLAFVVTHEFLWLLVAAIVGILSPSGNEVGPFLPIEQAALSQIVKDEDRTKVFAWFNLAGSLSTATGALVAGWLIVALRAAGGSDLGSFQFIAGIYALVGAALVLVFLFLPQKIELAPEHHEPGNTDRLGLQGSRKIVFQLSLLFALDAFGGGFIVQSLLALWFHTQWGVDPGTLGTILFVANLLAAGSALVAVRLADKFGLINTMVFTHIPSNVLLILVPLMPSLPWALGLLLLRFSISQMDVPTRQSYVMMVVAPAERSAAAGITALARTVGASTSPVLAGMILSATSLLGVPFFLAGGLKIAYDLLLYRSFKRSEAGRE